MAYGAVALLAAAVDFSGLGTDIRQIMLDKCRGACSINDSLHMDVSLPECCSKSVLAVLRRCEAMNWPKADTGGISFAEVHEGRVSVTTAVQRWLLAFFASRRRRLISSPAKKPT